MSLELPIKVDLGRIANDHPDAIVLRQELDEDVDEQIFAFKRPGRTQVNRITGAGKLGTNANNMVLQCLIEPSREDAVQIFERYPAAPLSLATALLEKVGLKDAVAVPLPSKSSPASSSE